MDTILIADGGSTKTSWALTRPDGTVISRLITPGINPVHASEAKLRESLAHVLPMLGDIIPDKVWYYGAGCLPHISGRVADALVSVTGCGDVEVNSDLLGAARSLLGDRRGIVCILGTGSNSGVYDGEKIISNIPSLGYILGDEGSGAVLGRLLIGDVLKEVFPPSLRAAFFSETGLTQAEIIDRVYRRPAPNTFLASLVPFLSRHIQEPNVRHLVTLELCHFMSRNVARYPGYQNMPVAFCGSIASEFLPQLRIAALFVGCEVDMVTASPLDGLIRFHALG